MRRSKIISRKNSDYRDQKNSHAQSNISKEFPYAELIGHEEIISSLKNLVDRDTRIQNFILWGPERIGKKTIARSLAAYLEGIKSNTKNFIIPLRHTPLLDSMILGETKGETIGIDVVRGIKEFLRTQPIKSPYRLVIIDNANQLTIEAQNALLKITEEGTLHGLIIFITKDYETLRDTLVSRFQKYYCGVVRTEIIHSWLISPCECTPTHAHAISLLSHGEPGRAYALLFNDAFKKIRETAREYQELRGIKRKNFIKELVLQNDFNLTEFLDALIEVNMLRYKEIKTYNPKLMTFLHTLLSIRKNAEFFGLNPRLQLEALEQNI